MRTTYNSIGSIFCSALNKTVVFNAKGFHHLNYKSDGTERKAKEKIHKLSLVPLAAAVIRNAVDIYEEREAEIFESKKMNSQKVKTRQYALVATVGRKKPIQVRVIILETVGSANPIFWSIMRHH